MPTHAFFVGAHVFFLDRFPTALPFSARLAVFSPVFARPPFFGRFCRRSPLFARFCHLRTFSTSAFDTAGVFHGRFRPRSQFFARFSRALRCR
jgi:hypothetical protein